MKQMFRWLTGNIRPDHCAFARFRSRHEEAINHLFAQVLSLCHEAGLAKVGKVYLDGTKMQAGQWILGGQPNVRAAWQREPGR